MVNKKVNTGTSSPLASSSKSSVASSRASKRSARQAHVQELPTVGENPTAENMDVSFESRFAGSTEKSSKTMTKRTITARSGLILPVNKFKKKLVKGNYASIIQKGKWEEILVSTGSHWIFFFCFKGAAIYATAVLEYLVAEVMELAGDAAKDNKFKRIKPRHIQLAVRNDEELEKLLRGITISQGGVLPYINPVLLPKRTVSHGTPAEP